MIVPLFVFLLCFAYTNAEERAALEKLYSELGGPYWASGYSRAIAQGGRPWNVTSNSSKYCEWAGVLCSGDRVFKLSLGQFNASGSYSAIQDSLLAFKSLSSLVLSRNLISGTIPNSIGEMTTLIEIDLSLNNISGTIPNSLLSLSKLSSIVLAHNDLSGTIPKIMPRGLVSYDLEDNFLEGAIDVNWSQSLQSINFGKNRLSGGFPETLLNLTQLLTLILRENNFTGTILDDFGNMTQLQVLDIQHNRFSGGPPNSPLIATPLMIYDISHNNFTGLIEELLNARGAGFPPSCQTSVPFLASMDVRNNPFNQGNGDVVLSELLNLLYETKPILSLDLDNLSISSSSYMMGSYERPNFFQGPNARVFESMNFECFETGYSGNGFQAIAFFPPHFWNYSNCICLPQYWGHPPNCRRCPDDVNCLGTTLKLSGGVYPVLAKHGSDLPTGSLLGVLGCFTFPNGTSPCKRGHIEYGHEHFEEELCAVGFEGRLCSECVCHVGHHHCYFPRGPDCVRCVPAQLWVIVTSAVVLVVSLLAFIFFPKGSGIIFLMESAIVVLLLFLGIGESYIFDLIIFFLIIQAIDALSQRNAEEVEQGDDKPFISIEGLTKLFLWYLQAAGLLIPEEFWPKITKQVVSALNVVNFHAASIYCIPFVREGAHHIGLELTKLLIVLAVPFLLCCLMIPTIGLRRLIEKQKAKRCPNFTWKDYLTFQCCQEPKPVQTVDMLVDSFHDIVVLKEPNAQTPPPTREPKGKKPIDTSDGEESRPLFHIQESHENHHHGDKDHEQKHHPFSPSFKIEAYSIILFIIYATLTEISASVFETVSCTADPFTGEPFLSAAPAVSCRSEQYELAKKIAWPVFVFWVLGIPITFAILLFKNRKKLTDHETEYWLGLLYENYSHSFWWWEIVWITRRLLLALAQGFFKESGWSAVIIASTLIGSICLMLLMEPFKHRMENLLEVLVTALLLTSWVAAMGKQEKEIEWVVLVLNAALVVCFLVLFAYQPAKKAWKKCCQDCGSD